MNQLVDKNSLAKFMTLLKGDLEGLMSVIVQNLSEFQMKFYGWMQISGFMPSGGSIAGFFSEGALDTELDFPVFGSSGLPSKKDLLRMWVPVLMDTTKNTNKTTPAKRLRRNNLLRFEDGSFAPVVGITQAMYEQCMNHNIYTLDIESGEYTRIYPLGEYDAVAQWEVDKARIKAGKPFQELLMENEAGGYTPVTHILRPWETTETKYTLGMANITTLYLLDQQKVPLDNLGVGEGRLWKGIFVNADSFFEGVDFSKWKLPPTAIGMCPITTINDGNDKARNFFYLYRGMEGCQSSPGKLSNNPTYEANRTYPRVGDISQSSNAKYARANNADVMASYPFAEGGYFAHNVFITALELAMGNRSLPFSNNSYTPDERTFFNQGGIRLKVAGTETWEYRSWTDNSDPMRWSQYGHGSSMIKVLKDSYPIEQCLESQLAASMAAELDIQPTEDGEEPHYFEFYGNKYYYKTVSWDLDSLKEGSMNVQLLKYTQATISAWSAGKGIEKTDFDVEIIQNTPLYNGVNLSGDIWAYYGGGLEMVGTPKAGATLGSAGNQIDLYVEPDQTKWLFETDDHKPAGQRFNFEDTYQLLATVNNLNNGYTLTRESYTPWKIAQASSLEQGESYYHWSDAQWISGTNRVRLSALFRGSASVYHTYSRTLNSTYSAAYKGPDISGSMQALVEIE